MKIDNVLKYRRKYLPIVVSFLLLIMTLSISYAFFIYNSYGANNMTFESGKIFMDLDNLSTGVTLDNQFPMTDEEGVIQTTSYGFTISGYSEIIEKPLYYEIIALPGAIQEGKTLFDDEVIKLYLTDDQGTPIYGPNYAYDFSAGGTSLGSNSFAGGTEEARITRNYILKVWISDNVIISNQSIEGKIAYTQEDYENRCLSIKLRINGSATPIA